MRLWFSSILAAAGALALYARGLGEYAVFMRAIRFQHYGSPAVLQLDDVPVPVPQARQVLVRMGAAGVNPVDAKIRSGRLQAFFPLRLPAIAGRDGAGEVAAAGPLVSGFEIGDRVCLIASDPSCGSYAEYVAVDETNVAPAPAKLSDIEAAAIPLAALSAWVALKKTVEVKPGMRVLVHGGAGTIGGLGVQLASHLGAHVIATCSSESVPYALANGAHAVIAYDREDFSDSVKDMDVVFDTIGGDVHDRSYRTLRRGGSLVYLLAAPITDRSAEYGINLRQALVYRQMAELRHACRLFDEGALATRIRKVLPLCQAELAHEEIETGHGQGRLVLHMAH
jgi:NADPH:quinone reductase-like Zn-dependent oxidoreductase